MNPLKPLPKLHLWYSAGGVFGSAHKKRMLELHQILIEEGFNLKLHDCTAILSDFSNLKLQSLERPSISTADTDFSEYHIVDLRDINPEIWQNSKRVLFFDNQNPMRHEWEKWEPFYFHDTLPHPDLNFDQSLSRLWFSRECLKYAALKIPKESLSIFYSGSLDVSAFDKNYQACQLMSQSLGLDKMIQIGQHQYPNNPDFLSRLDAAAFYALLAKSRVFFSYYGQGIFESLAFGNQPVLYTIDSSDHIKLSEFIANKMDLVIINPTESNNRFHSLYQKIAETLVKPPFPIHLQEGSKLIMSLINRLF